MGLDYTEAACVQEGRRVRYPPKIGLVVEIEVEETDSQTSVEVR